MHRFHPVCCQLFSDYNQSNQECVRENLQQITALLSLGGCPWVKPPVGIAVAMRLVKDMGLGKGISPLCTLFQLVCTQVPPLGLPLETKQDTVTNMPVLH